MNELVTFEQAKLLKELGFEEKVYLGFNERGAEIYPEHHGPYQRNFNELGVAYSRPTISHALDWCREVHRIHCVIDWHLTANYNLKWKFMADIIAGGVAGIGNNFDTYSETQSAALDAALEYIKQQRSLTMNTDK